MSDMKRREFMILLDGAAACRSRRAFWRQPARPADLHEVSERIDRRQTMQGSDLVVALAANAAGVLLAAIGCVFH